MSAFRRADFFQVLDRRIENPPAQAHLQLENRFLCEPGDNTCDAIRVSSTTAQSGEQSNDQGVEPPGSSTACRIIVTSTTLAAPLTPPTTADSNAQSPRSSQ